MRKWKFMELIDDYVFNDFQLSDYKIRRWYIDVESDTIVYSYIKFPIYLIFRNLKDPIVYEVSLSSLERLKIVELILEEL